jgi:hypothetical protein
MVIARRYCDPHHAAAMPSSPLRSPSARQPPPKTAQRASLARQVFKVTLQDKTVIKGTSQDTSRQLFGGR